MTKSRDRSITQFPAGHAEAVVGVVEVGRDAGAGGTTRDFDVMTP